MSDSLFQEGGPHHVRRLGGDQYSMSITLPHEADGRLARECPSASCSPGYYKIKPGTGITGKQVVAYCPYCRHEAEPEDFFTKAQRRYAEEIAIREAHKGVQGIIQNALGLGSSGRRTFGGGFISMELSYKPGSLPHVWRPFEEEVRRDVICPHCTLDQTVFGLATWCSDCGKDIFLTHVASELAVTKLMVGDIGRREELLGKRVAAKDLENCLEDAVSIFEAAIKAIVRRVLNTHGNESDAEEVLRKLGNAFQNIERTRKELSALFDCNSLDSPVFEKLKAAFEKRHPITHNLGVVDRKYLERAQAMEREGREVRISRDEVLELIQGVYDAVSRVHEALLVERT